MSTGSKVVSWIAALISAGIYISTLFFKFTGAAESIALFTKLAGEMEALMRFGTGIAELITAILLLVPATRPYGAVMSLGVISGAIMSHLTILGIVVDGDGGALFGMASLIFVSSLVLIFIHKDSLPLIGNKS